MEYKILYRPTYSLLEITLERGEEIFSEAGAMVYCSPTIEISTSMKGGIFGAFKRKLLGGESLFINKYVAREKGCVGLAPPYQGDVMAKELNGEFYVQSGGFLACTSGVDIDTKWGGAKTFFAREGLFLLKLHGNGKVFISSFGAIHEVEIKGEEFTIDTGHIVAFEQGLDFKVRPVGGIKTTLLSGEGLVAKFSGVGKVYVQSRSVDHYLGWLASLLPKSMSGR